MCGIAGFLNFPESFNSYIDTVAQVQGHRGPDNQAIWRKDNLTFCHQRLSIIDLTDEANQPMEKDGLVLIFNGEIYNYQKLRSQLITEFGSSFITTSDTEVVIESYRNKGSSCLDDFEGMFAFAIYDKRKKELFIARDPFGIKPLFYLEKGGQLAFASELKTLVQLPNFEKNLSEKALLAATNYLWLPETECMFDGVKKLPSGSFLLQSSSGEIHLEKYYKPQRKVIPMSEEEAIDKLNDALLASVERHMVADVPVSTFLSGGLDSSLLSVLAQKHNSQLSTYSINIQDEDQKVEQMPDDAKYARELANKYSFDHQEITITPKIADYLPKMVYHLDEPIGDPAAINTYLISEEARNNGSKVLLSGMGADEIFFGYRRQMATLLAMKFQKLPKALQKTAQFGAGLLPVQIAGAGFKPGRWAKRFSQFAGLPLAEAYMRSYSYYDNIEANNLYIRDISEDMNTLVNQHSEIFNNFYAADPINQMCETDIHMFMNGLNLTYTDRASMAASVEVRVPFIDQQVIDLAMSIPGEFKYKNGQQKNILKLVAEKYLPRNIIYRPKASFGAPIRSWISGSLKEMVGDLLSERNLKNRGIFEPKFVSRLIDDDKKGKKDNAYQIYELLTLELWFQNFLDK